MQDQPRALISTEVRAIWKANETRILVDADRRRRELQAGRCSLCGAPFEIVPAIVATVRYTCEHGK